MGRTLAIPPYWGLYSRRQGIVGQTRRTVPTFGTAFKDPKSLPGLVLWLRADKGITLNGSTVSQWADQSGHGNHASQGTAIHQPTYHASGGPNGLPYLSFSPASNPQYLSCASVVAQATSFTGFSAHQNTEVNLNFYVNYALSDVLNAEIYPDPTFPNRIISLIANNELDVQTAATTNWEEWTLSGTAAPLFDIRVNGADHTVSPNSDSPGTPSGTKFTTIGADASGLNGMLGNVNEVIIYNRVLNATEIASVEAYIRARTAIW